MHNSNSENDNQTNLVQGQDAAQKWWFQWSYGKDMSNPAALLRQCAIESFKAGARYDQKVTASFSPHLARWTEYMMWLGIFDVEESERPVTP